MCPRSERAGMAALILLTLLAPAVGRAQSAAPTPRSPQEERRRKLLEQMGLKQQRPAPPAPTADVPGPDAPATTGVGENPGVAKPGTGVVRGPRTPSAASPSFRRMIHPLFVQACKTCHVAGGPAATTPLVLSGEASADHAAILRVLDRRMPASSLLLTKTAGQKPHGGGAPWPVEGAAYQRVLAWIQGGARLDSGGDAEAAPGTPAKPRETTAAMPAPARPTRVAALAAATTGGDGAAPEASQTAAAVAAPSTAAAPPGVSEGIDFAGRVHPLLVSACAVCHAPKAIAAATRLALSDDPQADYPKVRALVDPASPALSALILKAAGQAHGGGAPLPVGSAGNVLLTTWVTEGAQDHAANPVVTGALASVSPAVPLVVAATVPPVPAAAQGSPLLALPYGLALNGRFDLAYERRDFSGDPFASAATNGLRSYHHFLFLSRETTDDPFGLSVELLNLTFWELHYRWRAQKLPVQIVLAGGKILVPFGADPLMHQSYGGLSGFDQRILPAIWAQEGVAAHALLHRGPLAVTDDLYLVRGFALHQADGILNLQSDVSPDDHARLGWGNRLGFAWGPLSAWYSAYYNGLGFGRRLFMQAGDVMLYRMRQIPVLGHFSFAAGLLRADVSGGDQPGTGGVGKDYYHFGSYFQARYHPTDWLYVQYRQGLRTFNNRRGIIVDGSRLTSDDGSTHNFGVVARTGGLTAGVYYFVNLEKVAEIPNDLLRVSLAYDF